MSSETSISLFQHDQLINDYKDISKRDSYYLCSMKEITLTIDDNKFETFIEFVKTLNYVRVSADEFTIRDFQRSLKEVKLMQKGNFLKNQ